MSTHTETNPFRNTNNRPACSLAALLSACCCLAAVGGVRADELPNEYVFDSMFGSEGSSLGQFQAPSGVAVDGNGHILIAEVGNDRISICDYQGDCYTIGGYGTIPGQFDSPGGVAVDQEGRIVVADTRNNRIQICDFEGLCEAFGQAGDQPGEFNRPLNIAVDSQNRIIIADKNNRRVQICDHQGQCTAFGGQGKAAGLFYEPDTVAVDSQGRIWVNDGLGWSPIQVCDYSGNCEAFGTGGSELGQFALNLGLTIDNFDRVVVADTGNHRVQVCDEDLDCFAFGSEGSGPGQFGVFSGLTVDRQHRIIVAENDKDRIQIFRRLFQINPGLNDAWFDPDTAGQGFVIVVFPELRVMFVAWYTFDTERPPQDVVANLGDAGHRWLTAVGAYQNNQATLNIELTGGGTFNATLPEDSQTPGYGTLSVEFEDCYSGTISYDIPSLGLQGQIQIERITDDLVPLCESLTAP